VLAWQSGPKKESGLGLARNAGLPDSILAAAQPVALGIQLGGWLSRGSLSATGQGDEGAGQGGSPLAPVESFW